MRADGTDDDHAAQERIDVVECPGRGRRGNDDDGEADNEADEGECLDHESGTPAKPDRDADDQQRKQVDEID